MNRKIIHIDMDAFYASVEQRDAPHLRGRPVAVGYGAARGVVAAASYEARAFGVRSAMPSITAMRKCPDLVFVPPRFDVYRAVSGQIHSIFREYTSLIEPLSLDEAYLDVTQHELLATDIANTIRAKILDVTGLTASAGISYNKFLAKMASGQRKPNNFFVIPPGRGEQFVAGLKIEKFHGVGPATAARMHTLGIFNGADLAGLTLDEAIERFGSSGQYYYKLARGIDDRPVQANRERKSLGAEDTFVSDISSLEAARSMVAPLIEKVWTGCQKRGLHGRTATLKIKYADFSQATRSRSLPHAFADIEELRRTVDALLVQAFPPRLPVRLLGVTASGFGDGKAETPEQISLPI